jgi:hypothetical protein
VTPRSARSSNQPRRTIVIIIAQIVGGIAFAISTALIVLSKP